MIREEIQMLIDDISTDKKRRWLVDCTHIFCEDIKIRYVGTLYALERYIIEEPKGINMTNKERISLTDACNSLLSRYNKELQDRSLLRIRKFYE